MKGTVSHLGERWRPLKRQVDAELHNHLGYIDQSLAGHHYLVGDTFSAADVQLSFIGELAAVRTDRSRFRRSEEHTSELQSLMRISYAVFCLKKKTEYMTLQNK